MKKPVNEMHEKVKRSKWGTVITVLLGLWLVAFAIAYLLSGNASLSVGEEKIVLIPVYGFISSDGSLGIPFSTDTTTSSQIVDYIEQAGKDESIKGIIIEINSGGGAVVASKEISNAIKNVRQQKPVVAWIRDVGASGAYWIASASDKIVADPMSITGSIGVTSSYLEFTGLMEEYGLRYEELTAGEYKDIGSPFRELKYDERVILEEKLEKIKENFVSAIADNRNVPREKVSEIATGMFYLGQEFYDYGFIDLLGGKNVAINITKGLAGVKEVKLVKFERKKSLLDVLSRISANAFYYIGRGIGAEFHDRAKLSEPIEVLA